MHKPGDITLEHIDPRTHPLISGFEGLQGYLNEVLATRSYNSIKNNWFVPYRVCDHPAPVTFGDIGEFLIQDFWCVTEFGGQWWMNEAKRLMSIYSPKPHAYTDWDERIKAKEAELGIYIIVCSENGTLTSKKRASKHCQHGVTYDTLGQMMALRACCRSGKNFSYLGEKVECPHCGKIGGALGMSLHIKTCKHKPP